ncbi:MAG: hypothetical protein LBG72_09865 [Spirochaetaceae bacterium]|jgi:hypothetical protein|nr:hypothetical protein [Spirochaetaceae bacterium]
MLHNKIGGGFANVPAGERKTTAALPRGNGLRRAALKKGLMVTMLAAFIGSGVFAQDGGDWKGRLFNLKSGPTKQNGVLFVDLGYTLGYLMLGGFGLGAGWEQKVNKNWTWLVNGAFGIYGDEFWLYKYSAVDFGAEASARYYFFGSAVDKLFINAGLGFTYYSWTYEWTGLSDKETYGWGALTIPIYAGWKFILGPGFVAEVDIGYRVGIGIIKPDGYTSGYNSPSMGGFIGGLRLGWAF